MRAAPAEAELGVAWAQEEDEEEQKEVMRSLGTSLELLDGLGP